VTPVSPIVVVAEYADSRIQRRISVCTRWPSKILHLGDTTLRLLGGEEVHTSVKFADVLARSPPHPLAPLPWGEGGPPDGGSGEGQVCNGDATLGGHSLRLGDPVMKPIFLSLFLSTAVLLRTAYSAELTDADIARRVVAQGGSVVTDAASHLTTVILRGTWVTDSDLDLLPRLSSLRSLDLSLTNITDLGMERLRSLQAISDLNLYYAELITDAGVAHLKSWKRLERLNLRGTKVNDTGLEHIASLTCLKSLDISFTEVTDNGLEHLMPLVELQELSIGGNKMSGSSLYSLRLLPRLTSLNLSGIQRTDSGLWSVAVTDLNLESIASLTQLQALNLGGEKITDLGLAKLGSLGELRSLDLSETQITDKGLQVLRALQKLESLNLWKCQRIDDGAVPHLVASKHLVTLDLADTGITDQGLELLQKTGQLRTLYLGGTKVTAAAVETFRRKNPRCQVSWGTAAFYKNSKRTSSEEGR